MRSKRERIVARRAKRKKGLKLPVRDVVQEVPQVKSPKLKVLFDKRLKYYDVDMSKNLDKDKSKAERKIKRKTKYDEEQV